VTKHLPKWTLDDASSLLAQLRAVPTDADHLEEETTVWVNNAGRVCARGFRHGNSFRVHVLGDFQHLPATFVAEDATKLYRNYRRVNGGGVR
jgi:hypothetical protein